MFQANSYNPTCEITTSPLISLLSAIMMVAISCSYIPKHYRIIKLRSSKGYSHYYFMLGFCSCASTLLTAIIFQWPLFLCCFGDTALRCLTRLLGFGQILAQVSMFFLLYGLYIAFFPIEYTFQLGNVCREWKKVIMVFLVNMLFLMIISVITFLIKAFFSHGNDYRLLLIWARSLGFISLFLTSFQCAPQIYKTWKIKTIGALSIPAMSIQAPGTILLIISLASSPGTDYSMWISYLISAICQGILLGQCIYYAYFYKSNHSSNRDDKITTDEINLNIDEHSSEDGIKACNDTRTLKYLEKI